MTTICLIILLCIVTTNGFEKFHRNLPWQFPYCSNLICDVVEHNGNYYASVADAYTFIRSQAVNVWPSESRLPVTCFAYKGRSYLFFKNNKTNKTEMLRNREDRAYKFPPYDRIIYDNFKRKLYLFGNNRILNLDLTKLESLWISEAEIGSLLGEFSLTLEGRVLDLLIHNDELEYITKDDGLALDFISQPLVRSPYSKNILNKQKIGEKRIISMTSTNMSTFDYILVDLMGEEEEEEEIKLSSLPLTLSYPRRPIYNENGVNIWLMILYLIDVAFFLFLIYLIRNFYPKDKPGFFELKPLITDFSERQIV
jgi:hypothetical protein